MDLAPLVKDNVTELLVKIIKFTQTRQKILTQNIKNINQSDFIPKDLAVEEFSDLLSSAIVEHINNQRLLLRDTESIKFGSNGSFQAKPIVDKHGQSVLKENRDEYLEMQISKLMENSLNLRLAAELLRQKEGRIPICD